MGEPWGVKLCWRYPFDDQNISPEALHWEDLAAVKLGVQLDLSIRDWF
jgi:hypothetical protein